MVYSDATFRMPSLLLAEANTEARWTPFLFELSYATEHFGACHSIDVPLAFATLDSPTGRPLIGEHPTPMSLRCRTNSTRHGSDSSSQANPDGPATAPTSERPEF